MRESRARIALLSMLVLNACDDSGAPPGGRTGVDAGAALETPEGFVRRFSAALCEAVADCQWPVGLVRPPRVPIAGRYADTDVDNADCAYEAGCAYERDVLPALRAALARGAMRYDPAAAARCLEALHGRCVWLNEAEGGRQFLEARCAGVFAGNVPMGGTCERGECVLGATCLTSGDGAPGTCVALGRGGDPCGGASPEGSACGPGLECDGVSCAPYRGHGDACGPSSGCAEGLRCEMGRCAEPPRAARGAPCGADDELVSCEHGLYCAASEPRYTCAAPVSAPGAPCVFGYPDPCLDGEHCVRPSARESAGTCRPLPGSGEACASAVPRCGPRLHCVDRTCRPLSGCGSTPGLDAGTPAPDATPPDAALLGDIGPGLDATATRDAGLDGATDAGADATTDGAMADHRANEAGVPCRDDVCAGRRVILFGGSSVPPSDLTSADDLWEWDGTAWTERTPMTRPRDRQNPALTYDVARRRVVLFGGVGFPPRGGSGTYLDDTWEWDGAGWTERTAATHPPGMSSVALAYDAVRRVVVLFGVEWRSVGAARAQTWEWDGAVWTDRTSAAQPSARGGSPLVYDAARRRVVLFGGLLADGRGTYLDDTWEWDGATWTERDPATRPPRRQAHALAYDVARGRTVLFGGIRYDDREVGFDDTWEWDGATWAERSPASRPGARSGHALVHDEARGRTVLFGGRATAGSSLQNDTWEWDGTGWTEVIQALRPHPRWNHALAY